ncbi:hypothetical protein AAVH_39331, partial [Aphelenchoides avenae]
VDSRNMDIHRAQRRRSQRTCVRLHVREGDRGKNDAVNVCMYRYRRVCFNRGSRARYRQHKAAGENRPRVLLEALVPAEGEQHHNEDNIPVLGGTLCRIRHLPAFKFGRLFSRVRKLLAKCG